MNRPIGVAILSSLYWLAGILMLIFGAFGLLIALAGGGPAVLALALVYLAIGGLVCWLGSGLWGLRQWAWSVVVGLSTLGIFTNIISLIFVRRIASFYAEAFPALFERGDVLPVALIFGGSLLIGVIILAYFLSVPIRDAFGVAGGLGQEGVREVARAGPRAVPSRQIASTRRCSNPACGRSLELEWSYCPYCHSDAASSVPVSHSTLRCSNPACGRQLRREWRLCPYCDAPGRKVASTGTPFP